MTEKGSGIGNTSSCSNIITPNKTASKQKGPISSGSVSRRLDLSMDMFPVEYFSFTSGLF